MGNLPAIHRISDQTTQWFAAHNVSPLDSHLSILKTLHRHL